MIYLEDKICPHQFTFIANSLNNSPQAKYLYLVYRKTCKLLLHLFQILK